MALKNLLVHLDQSPRSAVRLDLAASLARHHGARLVGLFAERGRPRSVGVVSTWPSDAYREAAAASRTAFEQATNGLAGAEWRDANRGGDLEITQAVTNLARQFDLTILGQHEEGQSPVPADMPEQVILNCGRPVLVIPYAGTISSLGHRPLIAWNHSRESARAVNDALPLIAGCNSVQIVMFTARPDLDETPADLIRHLADHGLKAEAELLSVEGIGIMDLLLNRLADLGSDLLVMGAHSHYGFPYLNRGSGTRFILGHMTVPVLMSN